MLRIKTTYSDLYFLLISVFAFTFLRKYLVLVLPIFFVLSFLIFNQKITRNITILFLVALLNVIIASLFYGLNIINNLLSFSLIFVPIIFLLGRPNPYHKNINYFSRFITISSIVLIIVDFSALVQLFLAVLRNGDLNDSFLGLYGKSGLAMHTLSLINFMYAVYFYFEKKRFKAIVLTFAGLLCFFNFGLILFITAIIIFIFYRKRVIKYFIPVIILVILFVIALKTINPWSFNYLKSNLRRSWYSLANLDYAKEMEGIMAYKYSVTPRKFTFHVGAFNRLLENPLIVFSGTGPGTYNSRTSFLLNGEYTKIEVFKRLFNIQPTFAEKDVYPLWNNKITYTYNDGTRNEPFSSIIALIIEYGLIFTVLFFLLFYDKTKIISKNSNQNISNFIRFSFIFYFLCLASDNYFEYPELSWIYFTILKCIETDIAQLEIQTHS